VMVADVPAGVSTHGGGQQHVVDDVDRHIATNQVRANHLGRVLRTFTCDVFSVWRVCVCVGVCLGVCVGVCV
jgi:hypothetical protein